jgi:Asp/Glu/hydantoin racemase
MNGNREKPKVALISSTRAVFVSMDAAFKAVFPEAEIAQILDETLLILFREDGGLSVRSRRKALQMALSAQDAGADGILVTCSSLSPAVEEIRSFLTIPILKIDEPMFDHVIQKAESLALVASAETVLKSAGPLVQKKAGQFGRKVSLRPVILADYWPLLQKDPVSFYKAVGEACTRAAQDCEAVVITQVSMAPGRDYAKPEVRGRVFAAPEYAVRALREILTIPK